MNLHHRIEEFEELIELTSNQVNIPSGAVRIVKLTKETDSAYLKKRNIPKEYNPTECYGFDLWRDKFNQDIKGRYETLHKDLLYTDEKQDFNHALEVFYSIDQILNEIDE